MKVQVAKFIGVRAIIYLLRLKRFIHCTGNASNIRHKSIALLITQFKQIAYVVSVRHEAATAIRLFLE
jgi:hypothetical protein